MTIKIANVSEEHWRYESLCSHIGEGQTEFEQAATMRRTWLERLAREGYLTITAVIDEKGHTIGFVHLVPIESPILTIDFRLVYAHAHS
jgi:hypothetical protein